MIPAEDFAYEKYTELYVKTKASASGYSAISDDYKNMIKDETTTFENLSKMPQTALTQGLLQTLKRNWLMLRKNMPIKS